MPLTRREFLQATASLCAGAVVLPRRVRGAAFASDPFALGVASGYPRPDGMVLWTRLAPDPHDPSGGMPAEDVTVAWEVAEDEGFRRIVSRGDTLAGPSFAHSVHVEPTGLEPERWYWYRFIAGDAVSPTGRTRTAPASDALPARLRYALASCQHYEHGYYNAYRHMVEDDPDLIVHTGDYIYEATWGSNLVRSHGAGPALTLEDYRLRHALYKTDPDLRRAHAACPWILTWDDHEVVNDYANDQSPRLDPRDVFLARRAAAYQAYYEHMPLPRSMLPIGALMPIYSRVQHGRLALFHVLDDRQYRDPQACPEAGRGGSRMLRDCMERLDPRRSMLGEAQERWLLDGLAEPPSRWNLIVQQTLMAQLDAEPGRARRFWTDGWDGYAPTRTRILQALHASRTPNPLVMGGDLHSFWVTDLKLDFDDPTSPVVAAEVVTTSITSQSMSEKRIEALARDNPHVKLATAMYRGYTRVDVTPDQTLIDLRAVSDVRTPESTCHTRASFVVQEGRPGAERA